MAKLPNLYQILGLKQSVCKEPDCDELIRRAYYERARISHPDKNKGRPDAEQLFELLTSAYEILKDAETREAYNQKLKAKSARDHTGLKKGFEKYAKNMPLQTDAQIDFLLPTEETQTTSERLEQLKSIRAQQDAYVPKKIFEGEFKPEIFNAYCDRYDQMTAKPAASIPKAWGESSLFSLAELEKPTQFFGMDTGSLFGSSSVEGGLFSTFVKEDRSFEDIDLNDLQPADYYSSHAVKTESYANDIKKRLQERQRLTEQIERNTMPSSIDSPYDTTINEVAALANGDELDEIDARLARLKGTQ